MSNQLDKLKSSIKKEYAKNFELNLMKSSGFIPVDKRQSDFWVILNKGSIANKAKIETLIKEKFTGLTPKFIPVESGDFEELITVVSNAEVKQEQPVAPQEVEKTEPTAEEMLVSIGWITQEQLDECVQESQNLNLPLDAIFNKKEYLSYERIVSYLKKKYGCEVVSKENIIVDQSILKMLPDNIMEQKHIVIMSMEENKLAVAMVDPSDRYTIREISLSTGRSLNVYAIPYFEYEGFLQDYIAQKKSEQHLKETEKIIASIEEETAQYNNEESLWSQVEKELQDASGNVAKFVYKIITDSIDSKASDIHIEPRIGYYVVRVRSDGILKKVLEIPGSIEMAVITRFKVLARMNIAEHRRPQDGTFSIKYNDRMYDFRINTLPVSGKEKVVIRILAPAVSLKAGGSGKMIIQGASEHDLQKIHDMVQAPNGIILTSGPTGSGKTTTLYTILKALNKEDVNITTIEDPIEIKLEGINQSQVNAKADITFASCMRAILRQDPDIILIGEIRDFETLEVAISAALTGHLVLSTVHTNSAAATVTRLIEMGAKDYLVSSTLTGVIAQRLVRKLCDKCKEAYFPDEEEAKHISNNPEVQQKLMKTKLYRHKGCKECGFLGYTGRIGIYEVMPITREIKKLIAQGAHDIEIEEAAVAAGMVTLKVSCLNHILDGNTTSDEFVRVLGYANE